MDLPYNIEAEKQVLANMIFSSDSLVEALARLKSSDFYVNEHKIIFDALREIYDSGQAKVEPYALIDKLSKDGTLEKVGDAPFILDLANSYIDVVNSKYYVNTVEERSILRQILLTAEKVINKWKQEAEGDYSNYILKIEKDINDITKRRKVGDFVSISSALEAYKTQVKNIKAGKGNVEGLTTGYETFDRLMLGFKPGEIYILAARPSVGKSALALNFLYRVALRTTKPCVFFSLEMGVDSVTNRILSAKSGVPIRKLQTASFDQEEENYLNKAARDLSNTNLYIDDTPAIKVVDMRSKLNQLQSRHGDIGLIVVDYIGLITPDVKSKNSDNRSLEISTISAALKALARDFKAPILVLSQLNREAAKTNGKDSEPAIPQLSNLRESGSIEQDADVVMFIHRPDYGRKQEAINGENTAVDPNASSDSPTSVIIAKNRNGSLATINFMFQKHIGRFVEMVDDKQ